MGISEKCRKIADVIPGLLETVNYLQETYLVEEKVILGKEPKEKYLQESLDHLGGHILWMSKHEQIDKEVGLEAIEIIQKLRYDFSIEKSSKLGDILFYGVLNKVIDCECGDKKL